MHFLVHFFIYARFKLQKVQTNAHLLPLPSISLMVIAPCPIVVNLTILVCHILAIGCWFFLVVEHCHRPLLVTHLLLQGWSQDLELGAILLLATCRGFGFRLYCLVGKSFLLLLFFYCVCRACFLLVRTKLFCLKFFKGLSCLFLVKLVDQSQFFFQLCYRLSIIFVVGLIFWACVCVCVEQVYGVPDIYVGSLTDWRVPHIVGPAYV